MSLSVTTHQINNQQLCTTYGITMLK